LAVVANISIENSMLKTEVLEKGSMSMVFYTWVSRS